MSMLSRRQFLSKAASSLAGGSLLAACSSGARLSSSEKRLNIFSWADYIHPEAIPEFEKRYGIQVIYDTFSSNEALTARLEAGATDYDIVVPSSYVVERLRRNNALSKIDHQRLPNYKYLMDRFRTMSYDRGNLYSIPYTFGSTGIAYNTASFKRHQLEPPDDWDIFWNSALRGRITLLEDARETIGFALKRRGYSFNSVNSGEIERALVDLRQQKPLVMCYSSDQVKTLLATSDALLSLAFSGDANQARQINKDVRYLIPRSGASMWIDNMCIPAGAPHMEAAHLWINYILEPQVAASLTNFTCFPTPNTGGIRLVNDDLLHDPTLYPSAEIMDRLEEIHDIGDGIFLYDKAWTELKCV